MYVQLQHSHAVTNSQQIAFESKQTRAKPEMHLKAVIIGLSSRTQGHRGIFVTVQFATGTKWQPNPALVIHQQHT